MNPIDNLFWLVGALVCAIAGLAVAVAAGSLVLDWAFDKWGGFKKLMKVAAYARKHDHEICKGD